MAHPAGAGAFDLLTNATSGSCVDLGGIELYGDSVAHNDHHHLVDLAAASSSHGAATLAALVREPPQGNAIPWPTPTQPRVPTPPGGP